MVSPEPGLILDVNVGHETWTMMVDTGAGVTIFTNDVFRKLNLDISPTATSATGVSGHAVQVICEAVIPFQLRDVAVPHDSIIIATSLGPSHGLLGLDFFTKYAGNVLVTERVAEFPFGRFILRRNGEGKVPRINIVKTEATAGENRTSQRVTRWPSGRTSSSSSRCGKAVQSMDENDIHESQKIVKFNTTASKIEADCSEVRGIEVADPRRRCNYDYESRILPTEAWKRSESPEEATQMYKTLMDVTLEENCIIILPVQIEAGRGQLFHVEVIEESESNCIIESIAPSDEEGRITILLINPSSQKPHIRIDEHTRFRQCTQTEINAITTDETKVQQWPLEDEDPTTDDFQELFDLSHIQSDERNKVMELLENYRDAFVHGDVGIGTTDLVEYKIDVQGALPIKKQPYRVPFTQFPYLRKAIQ
jgi:hypothetical protein